MVFVQKLAVAAFSLLLPIAFCTLPAGDPSVDDPTEQPPGSATAPETATASRAGIQIESVQYARAIDDQFNLVGGPVTSFYPNEPVLARIQIDGRPRSGTVTMRWMWRDLNLGEVLLDLSETNGGVLFSVGTDTIIRVTFTPAHLSYIGNSHRILVLYEGQEVGSYPIRIVPPPGAIATRFHSAQLYRRFDASVGPSEPTTTFAPSDTIYVGGTATMGNMSWADVVWTVGGQEVPALARTYTVDGNRDPAALLFEAAPPAGAWALGTHEVLLRVDDADVGTYTFTVSPPAP